MDTDNMFTTRRNILLCTVGFSMAACSKEERVENEDGTRSPANVDALEKRGAKNDAYMGPDIRVGAVLIPGLIESTESGLFIDLLNAVSSTYKQGKFIVTASPPNRVSHELQTLQIDAALPDLRVGDVNSQSYIYSTESLGKVAFVIYSNKNRPLTKSMIEQESSTSFKKFPFVIESAQIPFGFPTTELTEIESALKKVDSGRIHGLVWAQEEADVILRQLRLKNIRRELLGTYEDVFSIVKGERGQFVDQVLTSGIKKLRRSGELQRLYRKIHKPYNPWQP